MKFTQMYFNYCTKAVEMWHNPESDNNLLSVTKPTILKDFPFFSVDSSSWVNYQKYGATPVWDGVNFSQYDKDNKGIRQSLKMQCTKYGIKRYEFMHEKNQDDGLHNDDEGLTYSLRTWLDVFQNIKKFARTKLKHTLNQMVKGKAFEYMGEGKEEETKAKSSSLEDDLVGTDLELSEAKELTYEVDEETGEEVAVYDKRDKRISILDFEDNQGGSMFCDTCHIADNCPKYKAQSTCAFDFAPTQMIESPMAVIDHLIKAQTQRVNRAMLFEKAEGGMPNKTYATELKLLADLNDRKTNMIMMARAKGIKITEFSTTLDLSDGDDENGDPKPKQGGVASMLVNMMKDSDD